MTPAWIWLVGRGPLVWWAFFLVAVAVGAAFGPRLARYVGAWTARRRLARLGPARVDVPSGDSIATVLSGVLACEDEGAPFAAMSRDVPQDADGGEAAFEGEAAAGLTLVVGNGRLRFEGPIEVLHGSRAPGVASAGAKAVHVGDRVRVSGVVEALHEATGREGYRGTTPGWRIAPGVAGRVLVAYEGATASSLKRPVARVLGAASLAGAWVVASLVVGAALLVAAERARGPLEMRASRATCRGGGARMAAVAAAVPPLRTRALEHLGVSLACGVGRTRSTWDALDVVHRAMGTSCTARAALFEDLSDYERSAREWSRCGTPEAWWHAARLHFALGRLRDASAALTRVTINPREETAHRALYVHVLAGELRRAAEVARRMSDELLRVDGSRRSPRTFALLCVEASLLARGGDPRADDRLRALAAEEATELPRQRERACSLLQGWASGPEAREALALTLSRGRWNEWMNDYSPQARGLIALRARIARASAARDGGTTDDLAGAMLNQARFDAAMGAPAAALRALDEFDRHARGRTGHTPSVLARFEVAFEPDWRAACRGISPDVEPSATLCAGLDALALGGGAGAVRARFGTPVPPRGPVDGEGNLGGRRERALGVERLLWERFEVPDRSQVQGAVLQGDAASVVSELRGWHLEDGPLPRNALKLAHIAGAPAEPLRAWLRAGDHWVTEDHAEILRVLSQRLSIAEALGARDVADETRATLARHRAALVDEDNAMALDVAGSP